MVIKFPTECLIGTDVSIATQWARIVLNEESFMKLRKISHDIMRNFSWFHEGFRKFQVQLAFNERNPQKNFYHFFEPNLFIVLWWYKRLSPGDYFFWFLSSFPFQIGEKTKLWTLLWSDEFWLAKLWQSNFYFRTTRINERNQSGKQKNVF